jgi:hypothetical protein
VNHSELEICFAGEIRWWMNKLLFKEGNAIKPDRIVVVK